MIARPVADFDGAITQLLLPSRVSAGCWSALSPTARAESAAAGAPDSAGRKVTLCVASVNTLRRPLGKHESNPGGAWGCQGGCSPMRISSDFRSAAHITFERAISLVRLRVKP